jgi:tyrosine-protein kinase Etk/Wzc
MPDISEFSSEPTPARRSRASWATRIYRIKLIARRYWWIAALTIMLGLGIQSFRSYYQATHYYSTARMIVSGRLSLPQGDVYSEEATTFYGTQVALMKSPSTLNQARDRVGATHPEIPEDDTVLVEAEIEPRTAIFDLKVTSVNPEYARLMLDAIMDTYLENKRGRKNQTTDEAVSAITEEISKLDSEIRTDEQSLLDFQKENNVVYIEEQSSSSASYLVGLNNELERLIKEHDLLLLENKDPLLGKNADTIPPSDSTSTTTSSPDASNTSTSTDSSFTQTSPVLEQKDVIEKLKITRDQLGVYLKDKHPKMIALADQIDKEQQFLDVLLKRDSTGREALLEDLELQIKNLKDQIKVSNDNSLKLNASYSTYQDLKSKITREQSLYNQLSLSIQDVHFNKSLDQEDVVIMEAASKARPIPPDTILRLVYGFVGGLAVGVALIYLVNMLDDKIDSPLQLEESIDTPIVGQIPYTRIDKATKRVPLLAESDQRHEFLEYHRNLRSAILFQNTDEEKLKSLMICSAAPGEGKSTLVSNLAIVFAHSGIRVLLIDADLRRGVLHTLFDLPLDPGLSSYLRNEIRWADAVQKTPVANLDIITRGKVYFRAGDLLLGSNVDTLIRETAAKYDIVLWDSAPLLAAHDAANLCSKINAVLFVARVRHSSINSVRTALDDLAQRNAAIFGVVLNGVQPNQPGYYNKYRYKDYYEVVSEGSENSGA